MRFPAGSTRLARLGQVALSGTLLLALVGCGPTPDASKTGTTEKDEAPEPTRVVVVEDPPFAKMLQRQWSARTRNQLQLKQMTVQELNERRRLNADIMIYPSACLGRLAERNLIVTPPESVWNNGQYNQLDVFDLQRNAQIRWGDELYAFSFGSPVFVLMYRADLFAQHALTPPSTWDEYAALVEKLRRSELAEAAPPEGQPWVPACEPLAAGWAGKTLLARAAPYASHPSQFSVLFDYITMKPLIAGPPFVRALQELVAVNQQYADTCTQLAPEEARRRLFGGQTAMAFGWSSPARSSEAPVEMAAGVRIGFAELPGAEVAYNFGERKWTPYESKTPVRVPLIGIAGRLGSVARDARKPQQAAEILALLTGPQWSERLSPASSHTTLFRESHLQTPALWTDKGLTRESAENYAEVAGASQNRPIHLASIRIPGWQQYLQVLDNAVLAALTGEKTAQEALDHAAKRWAALTEELGLDAQREAYTRSLGLQP